MTSSDHHASSRRTGAVAGVVAGAWGLAVAELVSALSPRLRSPVVDVGDRVVDRVPAGVKTLAISWFGTNDKLALLVGISVVLILLAAAIGLAYRGQRRWLALAGVSLFSLIGALAALTSRQARPWWVIGPALAGGFATASALAVLGRIAGGRGEDGGAGPHDEPDGVDVSRRRVLVGMAGLAVSAAGVGWLGRQLRSRFSAAQSRAAVVLPSPAVSAPALSEASTAPVPGVSPFVTPNADFYRIDTALVVPQVPAEDWQLRVGGMVERPLVLSYDQLLSRPLTEADITLVCVSNEVGGGLAGNARWTGVRLDDLLSEAGLDPAADQIVGRSVDGYTCGFPVATLDGRPALVALAMNGEPLPLAHGFPARLIVPGLYGYVSATKWLTAIEVTRFDAFDQYWVPRGWDAQAPIKLQSRIDTPRGLATVPAGAVPIAGVAWQPTVGIRAVELSIDDGPWMAADLAREASSLTWRQWSYIWAATPGQHTITVRAIDTNGAIQTDARSEPMPSGATGRHQIVVLVGPGE